MGWNVVFLLCILFLAGLRSFPCVMMHYLHYRYMILDKRHLYTRGRWCWYDAHVKRASMAGLFFDRHSSQTGSPGVLGAARGQRPEENEENAEPEPQEYEEEKGPQNRYGTDVESSDGTSDSDSESYLDYEEEYEAGDTSDP
jgi:hypothetical protein